MENCLITKLKAVVDNPNLPILETMQQFTLDAIAASGNNNMTDAQKLSLNHFFYQMGAISNNSLWGKIKVVLLPMICGKNLPKSFVNYKGNIVEYVPNSSKWSFSDNGGLSGDGSANGTLTTKYIGSSVSLSYAVATMKTGFPLSSKCWSLGNVSENTNLYYVSKYNATNYQLVARGATYYLQTGEAEYDVSGIRVFSDRNVFNLINSASSDFVNIEDTTLNQANEPVTYTSETGRIQLRSASVDYGAAILSEVLSEVEMGKVIDAVKNLKLAFSMSA